MAGVRRNATLSLSAIPLTGLGTFTGKRLYMEPLTRIKRILRDTLNIGDRAERLADDSPLLGGLPEFDSMAVVNVVTMIEDEFGIVIDDDELSADVFATVGSLRSFVSQKLVG